MYSAQGFEFDYAGVIIGRDLTWTPTGWATVRQANLDPDQRSAPSFDTLVRHTYRVLATRAMRGVVLYAEDPAINHLLEDLGVPVLEG
ncbi:DNA/RNA helicase domain-containing protein [Acrocarpospora macrocephala]|uniref:DNA/RNA helicase domain-containing protein n=1 Tax=Acrocarpospora macrocephala TaxID=150177 RepID=UPI003CD0539B